MTITILPFDEKIDFLRKRFIPYTKDSENFLFRPRVKIEWDTDILKNNEDEWTKWTLALTNTWSYIEFPNNIEPNEFFDDECIKEVCEALRDINIKKFRKYPIYYIYNQLDGTYNISDRNTSHL